MIKRLQSFLISVYLIPEVKQRSQSHPVPLLIKRTKLILATNLRRMIVIASTHINAKIQALNDLLTEIDAEDYETIAQVKGSIHSSIESLEMLKEKYGE